MTPHWHQIKISNADAHNILEWIAAKIYEQASTAISISESDQVDFKLAIECGFLETTNDKASFVSSEIQQDYLTRYTADLLDRSWEDPDEFSDTLRQVIRFSTRIGCSREIASSAILLLSQEYEKDLANLLIKSSMLSYSIDPIKKNNFWSLYELFFEVFLSLTVETETILSIFDALGENFDRIRGQVHKTIEKVSSNSQDTAEYLFQELLLRSKTPVCFLLIDVLRGIAKSDLPEAHQRALLLSNANEPVLRRLGILALGDFNYSKEGNSQILLGSTLDQFKTLLSLSDPETDHVLVRAYGDILNHTNEAETVIFELSNSSNPAIWREVLYVLFMRADKSSSLSWYKKSLLNLVQIHEFSIKDIDTLDYCIKKYVADEPEFAIQMIGELSTRWKFTRYEGYKRLAEGLNETFRAFVDNQRPSLIAAFTQWLASNHRHLNLLAFDVNESFNAIPVLTQRGDIKKSTIPTITLSKEVLDMLDEQIVCNILYRIAGHVIDASSLSALLLSSLNQDQCSPRVSSLVKNLLVGYVLYNYPYEAGEYLQIRLQIESITQLERDIIKSALSDSNQYFDNRQKLLRLKEFQASSKQMYLLRLAHWKQQADMMESAERRSVLAQFIPSVVYKYGRAFSREIDGKVLEPTPFVSHSMSTEIPQGKHIDPVGQSYLRLKWQFAGLDEALQENNSKGEKNV